VRVAARVAVTGELAAGGGVDGGVMELSLRATAGAAAWAAAALAAAASGAAAKAVAADELSKAPVLLAPPSAISAMPSHPLGALPVDSHSDSEVSAHS
jgi:hypothetical protein